MEQVSEAIWTLVKIATGSVVFAFLVCTLAVILKATVSEWHIRQRKLEAELIPIHYTAKMLAVRKWMDELHAYNPETRPSHELSPYEDVTLLEEIAWIKTLDCLMDYEYDYQAVRKALGQRIVQLEERRLNLLDRAIQP